MLYLGTWSGICAVYLGTYYGAVLDSCSDAFLGEGTGCENDLSGSYFSNNAITTASPSPNPYPSLQIAEDLPPPFWRPTPPIWKEEREQKALLGIQWVLQITKFASILHPSLLSMSSVMKLQHPPHSKSRISHVTFFGQWDIFRCDRSKQWKDNC